MVQISVCFRPALGSYAKTCIVDAGGHIMIFSFASSVKGTLYEKASSLTA